jgi:hypothetical protein
MIAVHTDKFVDEHREEIEREAFQIYQKRCRYLQSDDPEANFLAAIDRVRARYRHNEGGEHAGQFVS